MVYIFRIGIRAACKNRKETQDICTENMMQAEKWTKTVIWLVCAVEAIIGSENISPSDSSSESRTRFLEFKMLPGAFDKGTNPRRLVNWVMSHGSHLIYIKSQPDI